MMKSKEQEKQLRAAIEKCEFEQMVQVTQWLEKWEGYWDEVDKWLDEVNSKYGFDVRENWKEMLLGEDSRRGCSVDDVLEKRKF